MGQRRGKHETESVKEFGFANFVFGNDHCALAYRDVEVTKVPEIGNLYSRHKHKSHTRCKIATNCSATGKSLD